jgi:hypothetical protein
MRKTYFAAALLGTALAATMTAPAQAAATAGTAFVVDDQDGQTVVFKAAPGKANRVVVSSGKTHLYLTIDDRHPTPGSPATTRSTATAATTPSSAVRGATGSTAVPATTG